MSAAEDWKTSAFEKQLYFAETLGSRPYDEVEKSNLFLLKKKVGFATCGKPNDLPASSNYYTGYTKDELQEIKSICVKVIEKSDQDPIKFACIKLIVHHKGASGEYPVFRINTNSGHLFIDPSARVYETWEGFMNDNKLPECEYCYPLNGKYNVEGGLAVNFSHSPASGLLSKTVDFLDTAGSVASVAAASVFAAGFFIAVGPAVATAAGATAVCSGVYGVSRSANTLYDRNKHDQSIGLSDRESRSAWMSIGSSAVGVTTVAALGKAKQLVESGKSLSKLGVLGLHALNASSFAFSGFGFLDSCTTYVDKYQKGVLTPRDVFDLSCELLFLFNAAASVHATTELVNTMSKATVGISPAQKAKMTKSQKRNFRRRAARRRARRLAAQVTEESYFVRGIAPGTPLQALIFEAVRHYVPRTEDINFTCHSISHDIICWRNNEMTMVTLLINLNRNLLRLYNRCLIDAEETSRKVEKYLSSSTHEKLKGEVYTLLKNRSNENSFAFCTKVVNMEDKVNTMLNDAEIDVRDLKHRLGIQTDENTYEEVDNGENSFDTVSVENDYSDDSDLNIETKSLFVRCADLIEVLESTCSTLEDLGYLLDAVKSVVTDEFTARLSIYKISLETTMSTLGTSFDLEDFHNTLNIKHEIDIVSQIFDKTLEDLTSRGSLNKVNSKYENVKFNSDSRSTALWDGIIDGTFHFRVNHSAERLPTPILLSVVSGIVGTSVTQANSKIVESGSVVVIQVKGETDSHVVCWKATEENCSSGITLIVK